MSKDGFPKIVACPYLPPLPMVPVDASDTIKSFTVALGGLLLVLSRYKPTDWNAALPMTYLVAKRLNDQLTKHGRVSIRAQLILDVMHEVASDADPVTMKALRNCLTQRQRYEATKSTSDSLSNPTSPPSPWLHPSGSISDVQQPHRSGNHCIDSQTAKLRNTLADRRRSKSSSSIPLIGPTSNAALDVRSIPAP